MLRMFPPLLQLTPRGLAAGSKAFFGSTACNGRFLGHRTLRLTGCSSGFVPLLRKHRGISMDTGYSRSSVWMRHLPFPL